MKKLDFIAEKRFLGFILGLIILILLFTGFTKSSEKKKNYNIVLISVDTIQWDVFNNKFKELDNVFKERSIKFNNTYTQIPFTYPSFTSLLTSLSPSSYRNNKQFKRGGKQ